MAKEFFLIGFRTTIGKQGWKVIDREVNTNLRTAEKFFKLRNNFKRILEKYNLIIVKSLKWIE